MGPVQSRCHESSPVGKRSLRWEGFVEKVGFRALSERVKQWWMMRVVMIIIEMSWQVNEEVSRDVTDEADGKNHGADSRDGVMHIWMRSAMMRMARFFYTDSSKSECAAVNCTKFERKKKLEVAHVPPTKVFQRLSE